MKKILLVTFGILLLPKIVFGYSIDSVNEDVNNTVVLQPTQVELEVSKLESKTFDIEVTNLTEATKTFNVLVKDVEVSDNDEEVVKVIEGNSYMSKYVTPELNTFSLKSQQKINLKINVRTDLSIDSGGHYAAILITDVSQTGGFQTTLRSSLGVLTFLKVGNEINESGLLRKFDVADGSRVFFKGEVPLAFSFENTGNVHLNPYGIVSIKNTFGKVISTETVSPWFVLPESIRTNRSISIPTEWKFGRYELILELNRGYDNNIDRENIHIYVYSWRPVSVMLIALLLVIGSIKRYKKIKREDNNGRGIWFYLYLVLLAIALMYTLTYNAKAERATSTNYILERDSINIGGNNSTSTNYTLEDTVGEVATGRGTSTNYILNAGYQQLDISILTITTPTDVNLSPNIHPTNGGTADGSATWTVTTNNANGYSLSIKASSDPAMAQISGSDSFADYSPATADPDYAWSVPSGSYEFGYSPNGSDISTRWKNDGVSDCNSGSNITNDVCWDGFTTSNVLIATDTSGNYPDGATTTVNFKVESNNGTPEPGDYRATLTLTALAL